MFSFVADLFLLFSYSGAFAENNSGIDLDLDITVLAQMALLVFLVLILNPLLFRPMLKLFEEREKKIEGVKEESSRLDAESAVAHIKFENEIAKGRKLANDEREKIEAEGRQREFEMMTEAQKEADILLQAGRQKAQKEKEDLRLALEADLDGLAKVMVSKLLGREV